MCKYFIILFILPFIWAFIIEPNLLSVKKYKIKADLNGLKIVFISDLHISKFDLHRLKRIVNLVNKQKPDIVLSCGDYIKGRSGKNTLNIDILTKELTKINAPIVSVLGNHDGLFDKYTLKNALEKSGIYVLLNSNIFIKGLYIAGVDDLKTGIPDIKKALNGTKTPKILLTHSPDIYYDVKESTELILAGHVHGGQVKLPFFGALIVPSKYGTKFACGLFKETQNTMIVSSGLGTSLMSMRFNNIPEVVVIEETI